MPRFSRKNCPSETHELNEKGNCVKGCPHASHEKNAKGKCVKRCKTGQIRNNNTGRCIKNTNQDSQDKTIIFKSMYRHYINHDMDNMPNVKRMADKVFDGLDELDADIETYGTTYVDKKDLQQLYDAYTKEQNNKANKMFQPVLKKGFNKPHFEGMEEWENLQEPKRAIKQRLPRRVSMRQSLSEPLFSPSNSRPKPWNRKKDDLSDSDSDSDSESTDYNIKPKMNRRKKITLVKTPSPIKKTVSLKPPSMIKKATLKRNLIDNRQQQSVIVKKKTQKQKPKPRWK